MSAFGVCAFGECAFESQSYYGTWIGIYPFYFESGSTVYITPSIISTVPVGTALTLYASQDNITWTEIESGIKSYIPFISAISGTTNLYIKIEMKSSYNNITPVVNSLGIVIHQETSLYTIATQVLVDGLTDVGSSWSIDEELQKYPVKYSWLESMSHREALAKIAEACGGVAYQDRYGNIKLEAGNYIKRKQYGDSIATINEDKIYSMSSPVSEVGNRIQIKTHPYTELSSQTVWTLSGDNDIEAGGIRTYTASYDYDAVVNPSVSITSTPTGATITSSTFYFGSAEIVVESPIAATITLTITGNPLKESGSRSIVETDGESIRRYGQKTIAITENNLIQSSVTAELIAESIIDITANANRDIEIDWRGDPTLELGDIVTTKNTNGVIISQEINYDGTLSATAQIRRF